MTDKVELGLALADVRRAYRLLWCYQDRLYDIIRTFADEFESLKFYVWRSNTAGPMDAGTNPVLRSPWSAAPLMNVSYLYRSGDDANNAKVGDLLMDIRVISDSGYDDTAHSASKADPDDFPGVETTSSRINLYAYYFTAEMKGNLLRDVWHQVEWPEPNEVVIEMESPPVKIIGASFDIADLIDKGAVQAAARSYKKSASTALGVSLS